MRIVAAFFLGYLLLLACSYVVFVGIYDGYFKSYSIDEFFNLVFITAQPWLIFALLALPFGWSLLYLKHSFLFRFLFLLAMLCCACSWQRDVGKWLGSYIFSEPAVLGSGIKVTLLYSVKDRSYFLMPNGSVSMIRR